MSFEPVTSTIPVASLVLAVCQDSKVFRIRKIPFSITLTGIIEVNGVIIMPSVSCDI